MLILRLYIWIFLTVEEFKISEQKKIYLRMNSTLHSLCFSYFPLFSKQNATNI